MLSVTIKLIMLGVVIVSVAALIGGTEPSKRKKIAPLPLLPFFINHQKFGAPPFCQLDVLPNF
jgi:hypothetical protein